MARQDEIILENLTNRGLGASPVAFRDLQVQNLPTLRAAIAESEAIRAQQQQERLAKLRSLVKPSGLGRGRQVQKPALSLQDFNRVIPIGYQPGTVNTGAGATAGVEPTLQLAKLLPSGGAKVINASAQTARQKFGIASHLGLPIFSSRSPGLLSSNNVSDLITDLSRSGNSLVGLRELQRLLSLQGQ